jgi:cyanophycin synthetase
MPSSEQAALVPGGEAGLCAGFVAGMQELAWAVPLLWQAAPPSAETIAPCSSALAAALPAARPAPDWQGPPEAAALRWVGHWTLEILREAGLPVFGPAEVVAPEVGEPGPWWLLIPAQGPTAAAVAAAFGWVRLELERVVGTFTAAGSVEELASLLGRLRALAPHGSNTVPLLRAAYEAGVPATHVAGAVYQFGQGARARLLKSTFTDRTPLIGAEWARDKRLAAAVLRRAGLPTPAHRLVGSHDDALAAACALGFPVVVKPADRDGGVGVAAGLETPEAVKAAFEAARACSDQVLVEQHVSGRDYRLTVFQGEVIWAIEREPGGVTGDGSRTVAALLEALNRDPRRGDGPHRPMAWVSLDAEALALLAEAGLSPSSVPPAGTYVRLRRAANISRGGTPRAVTDRVHPDNMALAVRAAAALHLDLAGVDLLIPDIGRSWLETGAAICEVNGQPELGTATTDRLHARVLHGLVRGNGRVPVVVVVGEDTGHALTVAIDARLSAAGHTVGRLDGRGAHVAGARIATRDEDSAAHLLDGTGALLADRRVTAVVLALPDVGALEAGLPVARFDVLVVMGGALADRQDPHVRALLAACDGTVVPVAHGSRALVVPPDVRLACWVTASVAPGEAAAYVQDAVREADAHHAASPRV